MSIDRQALDAMLVRHEGRRPFPYKDTTGHLTIGVGRNLDANGLSGSEIALLLDNDVARTVTGLTANLGPLFTALSEPRQRALVDMAFNLGVGGVLKFKQMLAALTRGDYTGAAAAMLDSEWARQVGSRAVELAQLVRTGIDSQ